MISARKFSYLSMKIRYSSNFAQFLSTKNIISLIDMLKLSIKITFYPNKTSQNSSSPKNIIQPYNHHSSNNLRKIAIVYDLLPNPTIKKHPLTATTHHLNHPPLVTILNTCTYHLPSHPSSAIIPILPALLQPCP